MVKYVIVILCAFVNVNLSAQEKKVTYFIIGTYISDLDEIVVTPIDQFELLASDSILNKTILRGIKATNNNRLKWHVAKKGFLTSEIPNFANVIHISQDLEELQQKEKLLLESPNSEIVRLEEFEFVFNSIRNSKRTNE